MRIIANMGDLDIPDKGGNLLRGKLCKQWPELAEVGK